MRSMQQQLGVLGTISALSYRHRETNIIGNNIYARISNSVFSKTH